VVSVTPLDILQALGLVALGSGVALFASMVGLGGGFIITPILILVFRLPAQNAIAISLMAILGTTISASFAYIRQGRVDYTLAVLYDILDVPGVILGAYLTTILPSSQLAAVVGLLIVALSILLLTKNHRSSPASKPGDKPGWERRKIDASGKAFKYRIARVELALLSSFLSGFITGFCGLGGGVTDTTTMILLGVPPHIAAASSEFAMALTNLIGVIAHGLLNNIRVEYALPLTAGTVVGAQVGSFLARRVRGEIIQDILALTALLMGLRLLFLSFV